VGSRIEALPETWKEWTTDKRRVTGVKILEKLREEGYQIGKTTVHEYLAEKKRQKAEVLIPLVHRAGEKAQVDFFEATAEVKGVRKKVWKFVMRLMDAGWDFVWLYDKCDQASFLAGHVRAFHYFGGVPKRCAVAVPDERFPRRQAIPGPSAGSPCSSW
jgi:transposase